MSEIVIGPMTYVGPYDYDGLSDTLTLDQATATSDGYLSQGDWNTFNSKVNSVSCSESTPSRTLNASFMPSSTNATYCVYTISISCSLSLTSGQTGSVALYSDANSSPSTLRARVTNTNTGTLAVGLNLVNSQESVLSYLVPAGHYVKLVSSGTATISITYQSEVAIVVA
jgi:hypothetical protein